MSILNEFVETMTHNGDVDLSNISHDTGVTFDGQMIQIFAFDVIDLLKQRIVGDIMVEYKSNDPNADVRCRYTCPVGDYIRPTIQIDSNLYCYWVTDIYDMIISGMSVEKVADKITDEYYRFVISKYFKVDGVI